MSSNLWNGLLDLFVGTGQEREVRDTLKLCAEVTSARSASPFADEKRLGRFLVDLIAEICERRGVTPSIPLGGMLWGTIKNLLYFDGILVELPEESVLRNLTLEEGVQMRATLNRQLHFLTDHDRLLTLWRNKLLNLFAGLLEYFPLSAFTDIDDNGIAADESVVLPEAKAYDLCDNLPELVERLIVSFYDDDIQNAHLFQPLRERFNSNLYRVSGIPDNTPHEEVNRRAILPTRNKNTSPEYLIEAYLQGTPFLPMFHDTLPFAIPFPARFEHTHVVGGTGHGKTQLLQFLINHDLVRAMRDGRSVVVLDSQGDLIRTISRLAYFGPAAAESLADRFVLVDPNDVEHPVCLNMFDFNRDRLSGYAPVDREKILNATVELYEYFFGALLGAELTQRQGLIFRYLARLLIEIPDATIHTLRELMEDGERFRPYMEQLSGTARSFFATRFFDRQFNETKKQILTRLWGVLSNASLERMFSHPTNKIDIFELLNEGKIILINTAKDLLGQEGSAIFGRFFIALIAQAAVQRAALPPHERRPSFVYIDEAQDYFDENISNLLHQARKYRVGLVFAHQNLDQLGAGLRSSVLASTTIKFVGGVSAKDANVLDSELRCPADFLMAQKKERDSTEFACHVRNFTAKALSVRIPLGYVESLPTMDASEQEELLEENRARYSTPPVIPPSAPFTPTPRPATERAAPEPRRPAAPPKPAEVPANSQPEVTPAMPEMAVQVRESAAVQPEAKRKPPPARKEAVQPGRGGQQHKYLQHLIKQLAEERGFRASIEETILNGAGRVDVSLVRGKSRIACEISVTTNQDQELGNVEKCLAAGYTGVLLVGSNERHIKALAKFVEENMDESDQGKVRYLVPERLTEYLDSLGEAPPPTEQTVRGYKVRTVQQVVDPKEAGARRQAIAEVIARSLKRNVGA
ncbi:MAG: type IV secretion system DNA-binding domain-containing protein [Acidobacteria bacterium]|nr:type IV secretion system DNA-binding domain-containing protein [Acidobacteriota bacterium]